MLGNIKPVPPPKKNEQDSIQCTTVEPQGVVEQELLNEGCTFPVQSV